jgi:hypothetical protein
MVFGARHTAGLGDSALFLRLSRLGQFWDWVAGELVNSESPDTGLLVVEYPNVSDVAQSWYGADVTVPDGGPWTVELVLASTGETVASDLAGALEARTLPAAEYATTNVAAAILSRVLRGFASVPVGGDGPAAGKVASMTFGDGRVVAFQYDPDDGHLIGSTDTADAP